LTLVAGKVDTEAVAKESDPGKGAAMGAVAGSVGGVRGRINAKQTAA